MKQFADLTHQYLQTFLGELIFFNDFANIPWEDTPNFPKKKEFPS